MRAAEEPSTKSLSRTAPRLLRSAYEYLVFYAALLYFGVLGVAFTCVGDHGDTAALAHKPAVAASGHA